MKPLKLKQDFSLKHTLECGQFFRWEQIGNWYYITSHGTLVKIKQDGNRLRYMTKPEKGAEFITHIFRLDDDLDAILKGISKDAVMRKAIKKYRGMRLMRQEPYECLISFVCSANSSIPNIKSKLDRMAALFGKCIKTDGHNFYILPKPKILSSVNASELRKHKIGYHSDFIKEVSDVVRRGGVNLKGLSKKKYEDARQALLSAFRGKGVGEKIADCVCLFALDKLDAFPIDV
ncbi:MAG: DNA-3-methyladenine glycosylase 2 family protein, partial [Thermoplasmata archaeon]|nr:DNA-3-methyladenine glycosylase 2 family protein [Thermoplasmata archaeon]